MNALSAILAKAEAFAAERRIDEAVPLGWRLAPDMLTLARQVQIATDHAKGCCARLAGAEVPKWLDDETTFVALRGRIAKTLDFVQSFAPDAIDGSEKRAITLTAGGRELRFNGQQYLIGFVLPKFYFHATAAACRSASGFLGVSWRDTTWHECAA